MTTGKRFSAREFEEVWEQAYEDVRELMESGALLLSTLTQIRQGVLGIEDEPRRKTRAS